MPTKRFDLVATVSTDNPEAIEPVLATLIGSHGTVDPVGASGSTSTGVGEFSVHATLQGESAKELNRAFLSALRKVEKKTRLRAEWSSEGQVEHYFDYVQKRKTSSK